MAMNKWIPESEPAILRRVGKTAEEAAELIKVCNRIVIQGLQGVDPSTGKSNLQALEEEVADVMAQCQVTIARFALDGPRLYARIEQKRGQMDEWEAMFQPREANRTDAPITDSTYFVVRNGGGAVFVKHGPFFVEQGGLESDWGRNWRRVTASSIEEARAIGEEVLP